jgi:citrate lyase subunit beta/citryl-CoA lyase
MPDMNSGFSRSYLFVPGNRPERFSKACSAGADAVIVDLEDAIPADEKAQARDALAGWLSPQRPVLIRVNGADTMWFREDLELCLLPGVAGVVVPKAERIDGLFSAEFSVAKVPIFPMIETALGFDHARILAQSDRVQRLMFGAIDFKLDMGIDGDDEELTFFRSRLVLASRLAGIQPPVDGVTTVFDDAAALRADTMRARRFGFGAKLCIHPRQVGPVNQHFGPSPEEVAWAHRILAGGAAANGAAVSVDGEMVDWPVILKARQVLEASASRTPPQAEPARPV